MTEELWLNIPGYSNFAVSNMGNIYDLKRGKQSKQSDKDGYKRLNLKNDEGQVNSLYVHRLVLLAFVGDSNLTVNHKNGVKTDNRLENLEYISLADNIRHAHNVLNLGNGENSGSNKLLESDVEAIIDVYDRFDFTQLELAENHGVSQANISYITRGKSWRHRKKSE